jgi:uncharacterized membrane protein
MLRQMKTITAKAVLACSLAFSFVTTPPAIITASVVLVGTQASCGADDLSKLHDRLNQTAKALNAAAKTNRQFYESGIYGPSGSPQAIEWRQKGAQAIGFANDKLIIALTLAKGLTKETFEQGKLGVLQALSQAVASLHVGKQEIDLVLQGIATIINQAVVIIGAFSSADLHFALPRIQTWKLPEVNAWAS